MMLLINIGDHYRKRFSIMENNQSSDVYYFWTDSDTNTHGVTDNFGFKAPSFQDGFLIDS